jgi:hypothetical protein
MDRDLVEQARRGDREAFAVLVHQVSDSLFAVAFRILRDAGLAEDALQNALVLAWRRIPHLREPDRFEAWIHRILFLVIEFFLLRGQAAGLAGSDSQGSIVVAVAHRAVHIAPGVFLRVLLKLRMGGHGTRLPEQ